MARITDEQKIKINELYIQCHNKSQVARDLGISVASVNKYLIPNYSAAKVELPKCSAIPLGYEDFAERMISIIDTQSCSAATAFCKVCELTDDEWEELKEIQKGLTV